MFLCWLIKPGLKVDFLNTPLKVPTWINFDVWDYDSSIPACRDFFFAVQTDCSKVKLDNSLGWYLVLKCLFFTE